MQSLLCLLKTLNFRPLSQQSLVWGVEISLKSINIQMQKNNGKFDLKSRSLHILSNFSYTRGDTGDYDTPKSSSYIGHSSTL